MFRSRSKDGQDDAAQVSAEPQTTRDPQAPKGRPTPKRAPQRRTFSSAPTSRKEAAKKARDARRVDMARQREALAGGDERYLPARDRGKPRRFARDFVDARWSVAEFFLPIAVIILALSLVQSMAVKNIVLLLWLGVIVMIIIDSVVTRAKLKKALTERFPGENTKGVPMYALMRTLQLRRMRLPKPQVKRGAKI